jgi:hypothetical protein
MKRNRPTPMSLSGLIGNLNFYWGKAAIFVFVEIK